MNKLSNRVIVRAVAKKYELSTEKEQKEDFERVIEEMKKEKPTSFIILAHFNEGPHEYGNWIHGEFSVKILAELTKEFENAYAEIIKKGYELK